MLELALDDVQRHALAGELERVRVTQLVRREATPDPRANGESSGLGRIQPVEDALQAEADVIEGSALLELLEKLFVDPALGGVFAC